MAERGYLMHTGQIAASGTIAEGFRDLELMRQLYLGGAAASRARRSA